MTIRKISNLYTPTAQNADKNCLSFTGKGGVVDKVIDQIDFNSKSMPVKGLMFIYAALIAARLVKSRDSNEFKETALRDIPGWFSWFYIAPAVGNGLSYLLDKASQSKAGNNDGKKWINLVLGNNGIDTKSFTDAVAPWKPFNTISFSDIDRMKTIMSETNYHALKKNKAISYLVSVGLAAAALGIVIPWLNTKLTRQRVLGKKEIPTLSAHGYGVTHKKQSPAVKIYAQDLKLS